MTTTKKAKVSVANQRKFEQIWLDLQRVSHEALAKATPPTPMIVGSPSTPFGNDIDYSKKTYFVADGVCGFAWVVVPNGRSAFAKWILETGKGYKHYQWGGGYKGVQFWVDGKGFAQTRQSLQLKEQVARGVSQHLNAIGIEAYADSRID
jgi:hypothetical protein